MDGKTLIHPKQIDAANKAFSPSEAELERAKRVIAAHQEAAKAGDHVAVLDGRLVEHLHVSHAQRLILVAEAIKSIDLV